MNWNKILSVFIVLFLIINLGLYTVRSIRDQRSYTLSSSRTQQLENMMRQKEVTMYDYLPEFYPKAILELKAAEWKKRRNLNKDFRRTRVSIGNHLSSGTGGQLSKRLAATCLLYWRS